MEDTDEEGEGNNLMMMLCRPIKNEDDVKVDGEDTDDECCIGELILVYIL